MGGLSSSLAGPLSGFHASTVTSQLAMWWQPIILISELIGFGMLVFALIALIRHQGRGQQGGLGAIAMSALVGILLLSLHATIGSMSATFFGSGVTNPLAYATPQGVSTLSSVDIMGLTIVRIVGLIGFVNGLIYLKRAGQDPSLLGHSLTRITGGLLAMHIVTVIHMASAMV